MSGYEVEIDEYATDTVVIGFPVKEEYFSKSKDEVSIWEQFNNAADMQAYWADNQVSVTITFKKEEAGSIGDCLEMYERKLKSVSLLPSEDHGYKQAPYEKISQEEYRQLISKIKPLNLNAAVHEVDEKFCDGDSCKI